MAPVLVGQLGVKVHLAYHAASLEWMVNADVLTSNTQNLMAILQ
jgi:hypothetical protein